MTAFISVASKAAGFIFAMRLFLGPFAGLESSWGPVVALIALVTMTLGNIIAIQQTNVKRLLAYSSISQAGYILVGFLGSRADAIGSVLFYLMAYTLTNIAAFAVVAAISHSLCSDNLTEYQGLARRKPTLAFVFLLALLSLAGIPPFKTCRPSAESKHTVR